MPSSASFDRDPLAIVLSAEHAAQVTGVDLELAGEMMRSTTKQRTARGVDVDGTPFAAYAPSYAKKRTKSGRSASPVDLFWSGRMLAALTIVTNSAIKEVALVIYNPDEVGYVDIGIGETRYGFSRQKVKNCPPLENGMRVRIEIDIAQRIATHTAECIRVVFAGLRSGAFLAFFDCRRIWPIENSQTRSYWNFGPPVFNLQDIVMSASRDHLS